MLRKILIPVVTLSLFMACGNNGEVNPSAPEDMTISGILIEQEANDEYLGTHLIQSENNVVIPARSLSINLSSENYLENKVEATGVMQEDGVFQINGLRILEILNDSDEKTEIQKYENSEFGFSLNHSSKFVVTEENNIVRFEAQNGDLALISQEPYSYSPTVYENGESDTALQSYLNSKNLTSDMVEIGKLSYEAAKITLPGGRIEYILYRFGLIYKIAFVPSTIPDPENERNFKDMVNSFQFVVLSSNHDFGGIDSEETPSDSNFPELEGFELERTFESLPYKFSGLYPKDWYYAGFLVNENGVLHRYGFGPEVIEDDNEVLNLYVMNINDTPASLSSYKIGDKTISFRSSGTYTQVFVSVGSYHFKFEGPSEYQQLMLHMAANISALN